MVGEIVRHSSSSRSSATSWPSVSGPPSHTTTRAPSSSWSSAKARAQSTCSSRRRRGRRPPPRAARRRAGSADATVRTRGRASGGASAKNRRVGSMASDAGRDGDARRRRLAPGGPLLADAGRRAAGAVVLGRDGGGAGDDDVGHPADGGEHGLVGRTREAARAAAPCRWRCRRPTRSCWRGPTGGPGARGRSSPATTATGSRSSSRRPGGAGHSIRMRRCTVARSAGPVDKMAGWGNRGDLSTRNSQVHPLVVHSPSPVGCSSCNCAPARTSGMAVVASVSVVG